MIASAIETDERVLGKVMGARSALGLLAVLGLVVVPTPTPALAQDAPVVAVVLGSPFQSVADGAVRGALVAHGLEVVPRDRSDAAIAFRAAGAVPTVEVAAQVRDELRARVLVMVELRPGPDGGAYFALHVLASGAEPQARFGSADERGLSTALAVALEEVLSGLPSPSPDASPAAVGAPPVPAPPLSNVSPAPTAGATSLVPGYGLQVSGNEEVCGLRVRSLARADAAWVEQLSGGQRVPRGAVVPLSVPPGSYVVRIRTCEGHELLAQPFRIEVAERGQGRVGFTSRYPVPAGISLVVASGIGTGPSLWPGLAYNAVLSVGWVLGDGRDGLALGVEIGAGLLHPWTGDSFFDPLFFGWAHLQVGTVDSGGARWLLGTGLALLNDVPLGSFGIGWESGAGTGTRQGIFFYFRENTFVMLFQLGGGLFL